MFPRAFRRSCGNTSIPVEESSPSELTDWSAVMESSEALLNRHVNGDGSTVSQTLNKHLGPTSPLLKPLLSPEQQEGLLACLKDGLTSVISQSWPASRWPVLPRRQRLSALSRLVAAITGEERLLASRPLRPRSFDGTTGVLLDNADGALSRLRCPLQTSQPEDSRRILDRQLRVGSGPHARTPESDQRRGRIEPHAGR